MLQKKIAAGIAKSKTALTVALPIAEMMFFKIKRLGNKMKISVANTLPPYKAFCILQNPT